MIYEFDDTKSALEKLKELYRKHGVVKVGLKSRYYTTFKYYLLFVFGDKIYLYGVRAKDSKKTLHKTAYEAYLKLIRKEQMYLFWSPGMYAHIHQIKIDDKICGFNLKRL